MELEIEVATAVDIESIVSMMQSALEHQDTIGEPRSFGTDRREEITRSVRHGSTFVASVDDRVVASFALQRDDKEIWPDADSGFIYLHRLVVTPSFQRTGIATQCLKFAESFAIARRFHGLRLDCVEDNQTLIDWYHRRGYIEVGRIRLAHWTRASIKFEKVL